MHYISPLGLNWYASCSLQTDVVQQRLKWEFIQDHPGIICNGGVSGALINFKVRQNVQVCGNTGASDSTSISSYFTSEYQAAYWQLCSNPKAICARVRERKKKKRSNPTLIVKHLSAVPASWTSMRRSSKHNLPTHNTCKELWSNKLILRALINL